MSIHAPLKGIILKSSQHTDYVGDSTHNVGIRVTFKRSYDSIMSLPWACMVMVTKKTVTDSPEPSQPGGMYIVHAPWSLPVTPKSLYTHRACPGHKASKQQSQKYNQVLLTLLLSMPGCLPISQMWKLRKIWYTGPWL
jgi:hypothetical protein